MPITAGWAASFKLAAWEHWTAEWPPPINPAGFILPAFCKAPRDFSARLPLLHVSIANPNTHEITLKLTLNASGPRQTLREIRSLPPKGFLFSSVSDLFGPTDFSNTYLEVEVTEGDGAVGFQVIQMQDQDTTLGLNAAVNTGSLESFSAQLASGPDIFTQLKLVNTSDQARAVTLRAVAEDGSNLADPVDVQLAGGAVIEEEISEIFEFSEDVVIGSLHVQSDGAGIIGDVIFGDPQSLEYAAALPLQRERFREAVFSQVASTLQLYTGLALMNPTAETAEVTLEMFSRAGLRTGTGSIELSAGNRIASLLSQLIPSAAGQSGGYLKITSTQPLIGQQLFGDYHQTFLSAVPPTIID